MTYKAGDIVVTRDNQVVQLMKFGNKYYPLSYHIGEDLHTVTADGDYSALFSGTSHNNDIVRHATDEERAKFLAASNAATEQDRKDCYLVQVVGHAAELRHIHSTLESAKAEAERLAGKNTGKIVRVLKIVAECQSEIKVIWL